MGRVSRCGVEFGKKKYGLGGGGGDDGGQGDACGGREG